jgi:hypothetical protein
MITRSLVAAPNSMRAGAPATQVENENARNRPHIRLFMKSTPMIDSDGERAAN